MGNTTTTTSDISRRLKTSLSQSLVQFYPLAGRFVAKENQIECTNQGVEFYETRVLHCQSEELLKEPNQISLSELVPCYHTCTKHSGREDALLAVQANFFDCGGLILGVSLSHIVGDMATFATFLNGWASTASMVGCAPAQKTPFVVHHHFFPHVPAAPRSALKIATNLTMKRFVIDKLDLAALRRKRGGSPSRVEAVTALVCRCMARATRKTGANNGEDERDFIVSLQCISDGKLTRHCLMTPAETSRSLLMCRQRALPRTTRMVN